MNTLAFLRDWKPGDIVSADELNAIVSVVSMLEAAAPGGGGAPSAPNSRRRQSDGPIEMPWQVYTVIDDNKIALRVIPGHVLCGIGDAASMHNYQTLQSGKEKVEDFEPAKACMVYLELTGEVTATRVAKGAVPENSYGATLESDGSFQHTKLSNPALRVTCSPADNALRVWTLAAYEPKHAQRVTQLLWGDLSALECRALLDSSGNAIWPQDRSSAEAWSNSGHRAGMSTVCACDFSTAKEAVTGTLSACIDLDGALEFYLGPTREASDGPFDDDPDFEEDEDEDGDPDDDDIPDNPTPVHPDPDDDPPSEPTRVHYGYVAGDGFKACTLVNDSAGKLYWELELDGDYLVSICKDLEAKATVTYTAGGTSSGVYADVEMGLGDCSANATGVFLTGGAALVFHGSNSVDASKKTATANATFKGSPSWTQEKKWYLSPDKLHKPGNFVKRDAGKYTGNPWVEAREWYRFRVNRESFRKGAQKLFKSELGKITVSDNNSSSVGDSTVTGTLSGTALNMTFALTLS